MSVLANIKKNRRQVNEIAHKYRASNARVFGSVAREEDTDRSNIDFLVSFYPGASLLDQVSLSDELSEFFHCQVDDKRSCFKSIYRQDSA